MTSPRPARSARLDPARAAPAAAASLAEDLTSRFELGSALGKGAFGAVHRARERATGREVALKLLHRDGSVAAVERFLREAAVAAALEHPGIVKVHAVGTHGGRPCIVYELIDGASLDQAARTLDHRRRVELVRDAARAVGHAHACGAVHRDLKPENILVDAAGRVRVADFGLATVEGADRITQTGAALGTPTHMAPEQFQGRTREDPGPGADVWSLGVVLYELLTGRLPFEGSSLLALAAEVDAARPTPPRRIDPTIPPAVEAVILRALARDPARRHPDAEALAAALDEALAAPARAPRWSPLLATAVVALVVGLVGAALASRAPDPAPSPSLGPPASAEPASAHVEPPAAAPPPRPYVARRLASARGRDDRWGLWIDDATVLTGGPADDLRLFDAFTGDERASWPRPARRAVRLDRSTVLLIARPEGTLFELDLEAGAITPVPLEGARDVEALAAGGDRVVALEDAVAHVLEAGTLRRVATLPSATESLRVALSPDGRRLALSAMEPEHTSSAPVLAFDLAALDRPGRRLKIFGRSRALCFAPDGRVLFVGTSTRQLFAFDLERGDAAARELVADDPGGVTRYAHAGPVRGVAVSPDGARLFTCGELLEAGATELRAWDVARGEAVWRSELEGRPTGLELAPSGGALLVGTEAHGVHLVPVPASALGAGPSDRPRPAAMTLPATASAPRWAVALGAGQVLTGGPADDVRLWDASTGQELGAWPELRGARAAGRSDDAVVVCLADRVCRLEPDVTDRGRVRTLMRPTRALGDAPDLACAASARAALLRASDGSWGLVFDTATGESLAELAVGRWSAATLSPRGDVVLACEVSGEASPDLVGALVLHRLGSPTLSAPELRLPIAGVARQLCYDPLGRRFFVGTSLRHVAAASLDQLQLGRFAVGDAPLSHSARVLALAVTPDGRTLLSAARLDDAASEVQAWDVDTRGPLRASDRVDGEVRTLDVSPDGRLYVAATLDGAVHVRPLGR